jgi:hypothetical protein
MAEPRRKFFPTGQGREPRKKRKAEREKRNTYKERHAYCVKYKDE